MHGRDLRDRRAGRGRVRPAFREFDDHTLVQVTGRTHRSATSGCRCPASSASVGTAVAAFASGNPQAGVLAAAGLAFLLAWLVLVNRIALPINKTLIAASYAGVTPSNARTLQDRWESIINLRWVLQGLALLAFCVAIALS